MTVTISSLTARPKTRHLGYMSHAGPKTVYRAQSGKRVLGAHRQSMFVCRCAHLHAQANAGQYFASILGGFWA